MQKLSNCIEKQRITQDKFQSVICWMLGLAAIVATFPPAILLISVASSGQAFGCIGEKFVVYAHYSTHEWLIEKFKAFQAFNAADSKDVCYELQIEDSILTDKAQPHVWIPETYYWIDAAEQRFGELIKDRETDCTELTNVPFGIITWKKLAKLLSPDGSAISFDLITKLAEEGWVQYTDSNITDVYPTVDDVYFAYGHPNVTSGGLLGFSNILSSMLSNETALSGSELNDYFDSYLDEANPSRCSMNSESQDFYVDLSTLQRHSIFTTPIDYTLPQVMMSRGPEFLQMAFGFENDVAHFNMEHKEEMLYIWNDTLAMLYLKDSYWIQHPICKLTAAAWYDTFQSKVATQFVAWLTDPEQEHIADLLKSGLRPYNKSIDVNTSVLSSENGCNLNIVTNNIRESPSVHTAACISETFADLKKHTRIALLLDVSEGMQKAVNAKETRWAAINDALPLLVDRLEDGAMMTLTCFFSELVEGYAAGCSQTKYPNGTLQYARESLKSYFQDAIKPRDGEENVHVFDSLLETYRAVNASRAAQPQYKWIILIITEPDTQSAQHQNEAAFKLLNSIPILEDPTGIPIFSILYYGGRDDSVTFATLEQLATRTNGQFTTADADDLQDTLIEYAYYW